MDEDPKNLVKRFVENVLERISKIAEEVNSLHPCPGIREEDDEEGNEEIVHLPKKVRNLWKTWVKQVPIFGFNSSRYDINMIKEYFVKNRAEISDVNVAKKENSYMFLSTPNFKFLTSRTFLLQV